MPRKEDFKAKRLEKDFQKKKNKLGKGKRPADNATNTEFRAQSIRVEMPKQREQGELTTHRGQTLEV